VAAGNRLNVLLITIDTLRADHMGAYGYRRPTSPRLDALARRGVVFDQAYTYWPKTRGSFVGIMTGRFASQTGYGKSHPLLLDFNPTLASVLKGAGYETAATVDNPNVAASLGYARGFDRYRETWEEKALRSEMDRTRAITADGVRRSWGEATVLPLLHYVNPTPRPPVGQGLPRRRGVGGPAPAGGRFHDGS
jgi:arylsulfatase A-like enzyme